MTPAVKKAVIKKINLIPQSVNAEESHPCVLTTAQIRLATYSYSHQSSATYYCRAADISKETLADKNVAITF